MPKICQDMTEICACFSQGMGIQIDKVGQNVAGKGAFCRWDILSPNQFFTPPDSTGNYAPSTRFFSFQTNVRI